MSAYTPRCVVCFCAVCSIEFGVHSGLQCASRVDCTIAPALARCPANQPVSALRQKIPATRRQCTKLSARSHKKAIHALAHYTPMAYSGSCASLRPQSSRSRSLRSWTTCRIASCSLLCCCARSRVYSYKVPVVFASCARLDPTEANVVEFVSSTSGIPRTKCFTCCTCIPRTKNPI